MPKKNFFSIHFAGGNRYSFKDFNRYLEKDFNIYHIELPGRGDRIDEDLISNIYDMRDDIYEQIKDKLDNDYILFGHSLGGLLVYLLTIFIQKKKQNRPNKLIISGKSSPNTKVKDIRYNLPQNEFIKKLKDLNGTPSAVLEHKELFEFFEPIIRADFQAIETFDYLENKKVKTDLMVLTGSEEKNFSKEEIFNWKNYTTKNYTFHELSGDHFFIYNDIEKVCNLIKSCSKN
ncbi:MAG: alpha/beta fold hydrolase [Campylobacterota bacterium]|nr:alpha/beta fold hydrolase [Campylobacterota bacterium]